ncbi:MAG: PAS domain S-box protein [Candidatus Competibacteraceae bacterium]|nr:PAS domain S-box protein [Candidatus Competibacteraceae bacterium]
MVNSFDPNSVHAFHAVVKAMPDPIFVLDRQGRYCGCYGGSSEHFVSPPDQLLGHTVEEVLPAQVAYELRTAIARVFEHGSAEQLEYELTIQQVVRYREARLVALGDDHVLVVVRDITETKRADIARQQAEIAQRESTALLHSMGDNLSNGYFYQVVIAPDGAMHYTYLSAGVERVVGITAAAVLHDPTLLIAQVLDEDRPAMMAASRAAMVNLTDFAVQVRKRLPSGEIRWVLIRSVPRPPLVDGRVIWEGIVLDITEFKQAEQALQESIKRYRSIFNVGNVGITITDAAGVMIEVNDAFAAMLGYTPTELVGRHFIEITHPDERTDELTQVERAADDPVHSARDWFEKRYLHRNGDTVWVRLAAQLVRDEKGTRVHDRSGRRHYGEQGDRSRSHLTRSCFECHFTRCHYH